MMTTCVVEQCKYVRANTGRATITIMVATTAHLVSSQSARKRTADPPAVPRDYAIKSHLALQRTPSARVVPDKSQTKGRNSSKLTF